MFARSLLFVILLWSAAWAGSDSGSNSHPDWPANHAEASRHVVHPARHVSIIDLPEKSRNKIFRKVLSSADRSLRDALRHEGQALYSQSWYWYYRDKYTSKDTDRALADEKYNFKRMFESARVAVEHKERALASLHLIEVLTKHASPSRDRKQRELIQIAHSYLADARWEPPLGASPGQAEILGVFSTARLLGLPLLDVTGPDSHLRSREFWESEAEAKLSSDSAHVRQLIRRNAPYDRYVKIPSLAIQPGKGIVPVDIEPADQRASWRKSNYQNVLMSVKEDTREGHATGSAPAVVSEQTLRWLYAPSRAPITSQHIQSWLLRKNFEA